VTSRRLIGASSCPVHRGGLLVATAFAGAVAAAVLGAPLLTP
jgi:hypothetical protein